MLGPTLETDRLLLRPPIAEDLDGWEAFGADPETMRFMGGVQPRAALWRAHAMMAGSWAVMHWVVDVLAWTDIIHVIAPDNAASKSVARRLGATNRGPGRLPEPVQDSFVELWGQTAEEWKARRSRP